MNKFDEMTKSLADLYQKITVSGKRAAAVTRMRIELSGLDRERRDYYSALGQKVNEMRKSGQISDAGLLVILETEFEKIDRITRKIQDTSDEIRKLNLSDTHQEGQEESDTETMNREKSENLLDSFGVI